VTKRTVPFVTPGLQIRSVFFLFGKGNVQSKKGLTQRHNCISILNTVNTHTHTICLIPGLECVSCSGCDVHARLCVLKGENIESDQLPGQPAHL